MAKQPFFSTKFACLLNKIVKKVSKINQSTPLWITVGIFFWLKKTKSQKKCLKLPPKIHFTSSKPRDFGQKTAKDPFWIKKGSKTVFGVLFEWFWHIFTLKIPLQRCKDWSIKSKYKDFMTPKRYLCWTFSLNLSTFNDYKSFKGVNSWVLLMYIGH